MELISAIFCFRLIIIDLIFSSHWKTREIPSKKFPDPTHVSTLSLGTWSFHRDNIVCLV